MADEIEHFSQPMDLFFSEPGDFVDKPSSSDAC
jgi:hypothetical protein